MERYAGPSMNDESQEPLGHVSAVYKCQSKDASFLCVHNALSKLKTDGDFDIGGTYKDSEPELWFFYSTSMCHGGNYLLNLFVCHRKTGSFIIYAASSNELKQNMSPQDDIPHLLLPEQPMTKYAFKSRKPNKNFHIKTYCFRNLDRFNQACTLFIPVKITVNPKFILDINLVKSIKAKHDLNGLLTKQETDFVLESATHKKFPTHKLLLVACSPVLRNMLRNSEPTSLFIDISDDDMELLIQFIHTGTIKDFMKQDCLKLLDIANKFQLAQLFTLVSHNFADRITVDNAVETAVIAKKYKMEDLQKIVFAFIAKHPKVLETDAWNNLTDVELTKHLFQYTRSMKK